MDKATLDEVRAWAKARVDSGKEPPWTYHNLVTLANITKELSAGLDAAKQTETVPLLQEYQAERPEQEDKIVRLSTLRSRPDDEDRVALPT